ncbi:MAG TPA: PRTRC system protein C [Nevskia sp.]|nr:PRTRC system protein C [Nevskia sp.]
MSTIITPKRTFKFNGITLQDVDPTMTPEQVIEAYTPNYPSLAYCVVGEPQVADDGSEITYVIDKPPAKTKGL